MPILALQNPTYQPAMRIIASITNASPAVVTTTFDHDYITGDIVRLYIPRGFGMLQADRLKGTVTVTGDTTFTIDIDTTDFDSLVVPPDNPIGVTPGPVNVPGGVNQLQLGQIFTVLFDIFTINQLGAGVITATSNPAITCTIDSTVDPNTVIFAGAVAGSDISYFIGQPYHDPSSRAQVVPVGEVNSLLRGATRNVLRSPR